MKQTFCTNVIIFSMILSTTGYSHIAFAESESSESSIESISGTKNEHRPHRKHGPHMELTTEQKACLESKIGKPEVAERPSREVMEAAFKACEIVPPKRPN